MGRIIWETVTITTRGILTIFLGDYGKQVLVCSCQLPSLGMLNCRAPAECVNRLSQLSPSFNLDLAVSKYMFLQFMLNRSFWKAPKVSQIIILIVVLIHPQENIATLRNQTSSHHLETRYRCVSSVTQRSMAKDSKSNTEDILHVRLLSAPPQQFPIYVGTI